MPGGLEDRLPEYAFDYRKARQNRFAPGVEEGSLLEQSDHELVQGGQVAESGERIMAHSTVADLTVDEFKKLIREVVIPTLSEMLGDPNEGLELNDELKLELQRSLAAVEAGGKTTPAHEVAARLGLTW